MQVINRPGIHHFTSHHVEESPEVLERILDPEVNLCLWRRPVQVDIAQELLALGALDLPDVRPETSSSSFSQDIITLMAEHQLDPDRFANLRADLEALVSRFSQVSEGRNLRFRLVTTTDNDCKRFHLDRRNLRLICTYQGPGTEWLTDDQVDREALAACSHCASVSRYGEPSQFHRFWVGIMRGDPANVGTGLVHRSPTIEGTGQVRVLFCLDS